jgi:hypothetical protein
VDESTVDESTVDESTADESTGKTSLISIVIVSDIIIYQRTFIRKKGRGHRGNVVSPKIEFKQTK